MSSISHSPVHHASSSPRSVTSFGALLSAPAAATAANAEHESSPGASRSSLAGPSHSPVGVGLMAVGSAQGSVPRRKLPNAKGRTPLPNSRDEGFKTEEAAQILVCMSQGSLTQVAAATNPAPSSPSASSSSSSSSSLVAPAASSVSPAHSSHPVPSASSAEQTPARSVGGNLVLCECNDCTQTGSRDGKRVSSKTRSAHDKAQRIAAEGNRVEDDEACKRCREHKNECFRSMSNDKLACSTCTKFKEKCSFTGRDERAGLNPRKRKLGVL